MSQTREHLLIAKHFGAENVVVFISKLDAANKEMSEVVEMEVRDLLKDTGYDADKVPVIHGSAQHALNGTENAMGRDSIKKLLEAIESHITVPTREKEKPLFMAVEHVHSVPGKIDWLFVWLFDWLISCRFFPGQGTICMGHMRRGTIKKGDALEIIGLNKVFKSSVTGLENFKQTLDHGEAGDYLSVRVQDVKRDELKRGMLLIKPGMQFWMDFIPWSALRSEWSLNFKTGFCSKCDGQNDYDVKSCRRMWILLSYLSLSCYALLILISLK